MELMTSGSFINLENREKIAQLEFTAREIAETAANTEGFSFDEEKNKRLAVEIWEGAEYMCRDQEKVSIKNIFLTSFLDRLKELLKTNFAETREIEHDNGKAQTNVENSISIDVSEPEIELETANTDVSTSEPEHKSLGQSGLQQIPDDKKLSDEISEQILAQNESKSEVDDKNFEKTTEDLPEEQDFCEQDKEIALPATLNDSAEISQSSEAGEIEIPVNTSNNRSEEAIGKNETLDSQDKLPNEGVVAISLPEEEPYRWEKATITATIQILPVCKNKKRKVVLSVRTHDFPPQMSIVEAADENFEKDLSSSLNAAFLSYKQKLPTLVMDKLRQEKDSSRKRNSFESNTSVPESGEVVPSSNQQKQQQSGSQASLFAS